MTGSAPEKLVRYVKGEELHDYEIHDTEATLSKALLPKGQDTWAC